MAWKDTINIPINQTARVLVKFDDGKKEEKVSFGKNGSDVYALIAGQPGAGKIEAEKFDEANKALDELSK